MQGTTLANGTEKHPDTNWNATDWRQEERRVRNLRQRIFRATQAGDGNASAHSRSSCCAAARTDW